MNKIFICNKLSFTKTAEKFQKKIPCRKSQFMQLTSVSQVYL